MPEWRPIKLSICRSSGLSKASPYVALFYTWGILQADAHGLMRRDEAKALVFPNRNSEAKVQAAVDWLVEHGKLCEQEYRGRRFIHWCWFDLHQPAGAKRGRGAPAFVFTCPNEGRLIDRDPESDSRELRETPRDSARLAPRRDQRRSDQRRSDLQQKHRRSITSTPVAAQQQPHPQEARSAFLEACRREWPTMGDDGWQESAAIEDEVGPEIALAALNESRRSSTTGRATLKHVRAIAEAAFREGRMPGEGGGRANRRNAQTGGGAGESPGAAAARFVAERERAFADG